MGRKSQTKILIHLLLLALVLSISFAYYAYAASFSSSVSIPPASIAAVSAGAANQLFNFSVNNTDLEIR